MKKINRTFEEDKIYAQEHKSLKRFSFNQQVVDVFPDMINRSVPGYPIILEGIGQLAKLHCPQNATIYDLGCSLGSASLSIAKQLYDTQAHIIGIDKSEAMIDRCRQHIASYHYGQCIEIKYGDLTNVELSPCNMAVINFTLQFLEPEKRLSLLENVYQNLQQSGVLILSEKIKHNDANIEKTMVSLHHNFKRDNGYSDLEISQKRSALEEVMKLDTLSTHFERLQSVGFTNIGVWYQHFNFISIIAIK